MAIRTNRPQVFDRIDDVFTTNLRQGAKVMDVNVTCCFLTVDRTEAESTDATVGAVMFDASISSNGIAFVSVDSSLTDRTFSKCKSGLDFFWKIDFPTFNPTVSV